MLLITCEECERRALFFQSAPNACPECGGSATVRREVKIPIPMEHDDFPELRTPLPREDLVFTG